MHSNILLKNKNISNALKGSISNSYIIMLLSESSYFGSTVYIMLGLNNFFPSVISLLNFLLEKLIDSVAP